MRAGQMTRPSRYALVAAMCLKSVCRGFVNLVTAVGILAIWASFSSNLLAKTSAQDESAPSLIGNYLSGRFARAGHEPDRAAEFYAAALDRDNDVVLLEHTFQIGRAHV